MKASILTIVTLSLALKISGLSNVLNRSTCPSSFPQKLSFLNKSPSFMQKSKREYKSGCWGFYADEKRCLMGLPQLQLNYESNMAIGGSLGYQFFQSPRSCGCSDFCILMGFTGGLYASYYPREKVSDVSVLLAHRWIFLEYGLNMGYTANHLFSGAPKPSIEYLHVDPTLALELYTYRLACTFVVRSKTYDNDRIALKVSIGFSPVVFCKDNKKKFKEAYKDLKSKK